MDNHSPERLLPFNLDLVFRRGLGRTLLFCFFGLAMVPLAFVGFISYQTAYHHLEREVRQNIRIAAESKSRQLQVFFDDRLADADRLARERTTVNQMLRTPVEPGSDLQVYLVDSDLTPLAGDIEVQHLDEDSTVDTAQTRLWLQYLTGGNSELPLPAPFTYAGPGGNLVMGAYREIRLGNAPYALIVEIETKAAFGAINRLRAIIVTIMILTGVGALVASTVLAQMIVGPVRDLSENTLRVVKGRFNHNIHVTANHEIGELAAAFDGMVHHLKSVKAENDTQSRFMSGLASLHRLIGGEQELGELCINTLEFLSGFLDLCQADFFIVNGDGGLKCASRFPGHPDGENQQILYPGEGRVGQAAIGKTIVVFRKEAVSGLVTPVPSVDLANLIAVPLMLRQTAKGVLELEKTGVFSRFDCRFVEAVAEVIAVAVNSALTREQEEALLERTREQAQKLKVREAALEASTRELQVQSRSFQSSEKKLQFKQLELEAANAQMVKNAADLEAHMAILETQKLDMERQNTELEKTHGELAEKARQLEISSRYKTEFMANMSHELRTPLNSILLLSRLLLENKEKTLAAKQSEFARTIHSAGEDLLNLINEILDLAMVESGKMAVEPAPVRVQSIADAMQVSFAALAEQSGVTFTSHVAPDVPEGLITDRKRIEQIVKNFLSNAFKFTPTGSIRLEIAVSRDRVLCRGTGDSDDNGCLAISVEDTGIGIPTGKHQMVFEAFQQLDGSTRRKYGGAGLGLSISRELARLLGAEITMESEAGRGSRFTLHLPIIPLPDKAPAAIQTDPFRIRSIETVEPPSKSNDDDASPDPVPDNRDRLQAMDSHPSGLKGRKVLLVDDDMRTVFAISSVLEDQGAEVITGKNGKESLDKLNRFPDIDLILMDVMISEVNGYQSIREIRNRNRYSALPIIALTAKAMKGDRAKCIEAGADDYLAKPVNLDKLTSMLKIWLEPQLIAPKPNGA